MVIGRKNLVFDICGRHNVNDNREGRVKGHAEKVQKISGEEKNDAQYKSQR